MAGANVIAPVMSLIVYVTGVTLPKKPATGTKVTVPFAFALKVPCPRIVIAAVLFTNKIDALFIVLFPSASVSASTPEALPVITGIITFVF